MTQSEEQREEMSNKNDTPTASGTCRECGMIWHMLLHKREQIMKEQKQTSDETKPWN